MLSVLWGSTVNNAVEGWKLMSETFLIKFCGKVSHWLSVWWYGNFEVKLFQLSFLRKFLIGCQFGGMETFK